MKKKSKKSINSFKTTAVVLTDKETLKVKGGIDVFFVTIQLSQA